MCIAPENRERAPTRAPALHRRVLAAAGLCAVLVPAVAALAQENRGAIELTGFAAYNFNGEFDAEDTDATVNLDDAAGFGLILNGWDSAETQWEIYYSQQETSGDTAAVPGLGSDTDIDMQVLQLGGTYRWDGSMMRPFMSAGIGGTFVDPDSSALDSETFWSFSLGAGMQFFPEERWGLRLELRGIGTVVDSDSDLFCVSAGGAVCAFQLEGHVHWQMQAMAGATFRF
jgi:opacity protein-like surface antigen